MRAAPRRVQRAGSRHHRWRPRRLTRRGRRAGMARAPRRRPGARAGVGGRGGRGEAGAEAEVASGRVGPTGRPRRPRVPRRLLGKGHAGRQAAARGAEDRAAGASGHKPALGGRVLGATWLPGYFRGRPRPKGPHLARRGTAVAARRRGGCRGGKEQNRERGQARRGHGGRRASAAGAEGPTGGLPVSRRRCRARGRGGGRAFRVSARALEHAKRVLDRARGAPGDTGPRDGIPALPR
jgi:hypothetical protein